MVLQLDCADQHVAFTSYQRLLPGRIFVASDFGDELRKSRKARAFVGSLTSPRSVSFTTFLTASSSLTGDADQTIQNFSVP